MPYYNMHAMRAGDFPLKDFSSHDLLSVHELTPGDIDVVGAMGDSYTVCDLTTIG